MKRFVILCALLGSGQCYSIETAEPFSTAVSTSLVSRESLSSMLAGARAPAEEVTRFASVAYLNGDGYSLLALTPGVAFSKNQVDLMLARLKLDGGDDLRIMRLRYKRALVTDAPVNVSGFGSFQDVEDSAQVMRVGFAADRTLLRRESGASSSQVTLTGNLSYIRVDPEFGGAEGDILAVVAAGWSNGSAGLSVEHQFKSDVGIAVTTFGVLIGKYFKASYDTEETGQVGVIFKW